MKTYVFSIQLNGWNIYRLQERVAEIASGIPTEKEAMEIVLGCAKQNAPSEVLRIGHNGESSLIAKFEEEGEV
jgi:hypothetical protein